MSADENTSAGVFLFSGVCEWWRQCAERGHVPIWCTLIQMLLVVQPNSASMERLLSMLKAGMEKSQLQDAVEMNAMGDYNHRKGNA